MAERYRGNRASAKRLPLTELHNRANTPPVTQRPVRAGKSSVASASPQHLPHNESLEPNGSLAVRSNHEHSPEAKRVSRTGIDNDDPDGKRLSAISTTSTAAGFGRKRKTFIGHWQLGKTIGKGGCSRVRVVRHRYRDQFGAVKIITRSVAESTRAQSLANLIESTKGTTTYTAAGHKPIPYGLEREIAVMKLLEHPNIVRLYDVWENRNELYLIMEYVDGGELFHYVDSRKGLPEDETVFIFRQIVSALLYCHRLLICHRDLKPENILLDQKEMTVKLIDFGMAALQPEGRLLSTPCGSPHYAAPEVISGKSYDGAMADVWSCGVILYVMLTGTTPYNYSPDGDIRSLFRDISRANFWMPPNLSAEAKDLIRRVFVANPKKRITMDQVWDHPLLHKFDREFGLDGPEGSKLVAIGPSPKIDQWKVKRIQDIDREILRNMRTLWHSEPEQSLIQKLLNNELNQEKLFYAALIKHREENMENYVGEPDDMSYSASDYHHSQPVKSEDTPPMPTDKAPRSQSQYSILNDEHTRRYQNAHPIPPPSVSSYDPYRASKNAIVNHSGDYTDVTVHRTGSASTRREVKGRTLRHPNPTRIEKFKQHSHRTSNLSSASLPRSGRSRASMPRSSFSRNSLNSSLWPSSPPAIASMRPSDLHKRNVSFRHLRRVSTTSALASHESPRPSIASPGLPEGLRDYKAKLEAANQPPMTPSPAKQADYTVRSRKETATAAKTPRIKVSNVDTPGHHVRSEIRKHSAELEKACQEAFFRSSVGSDTTAQTSVTDLLVPYDTPPSSISMRPARLSQGSDSKSKSTRPLPELPRDTPNTYLTKTLEETRDKLAAYRANPADNTAKFDEVMKMLEDIMPTPIALPQKRVLSAPEPKTSDQLGFLPMITEEGDPRSSRDGGSNWQRAVTSPLQRTAKQADQTLRMVAASPNGTVAPLNVRKRGNDSPMGRTSERPLKSKASTDALSRLREESRVRSLAADDNDATLDASELGQKKRHRLFGLRRKESTADTRADEQDEVNEKGERQVSRVLTKEMPRSKFLMNERPASAVSGEFPMREKEAAKGKKGLAKWLAKIRRDRASNDDANGGEPDIADPAHRSLNSLFSSSSPSPSSSNDAPPAAGPGRSWFARFFHLKPEVQILCFALPRGRARQELVLLLREWQAHGIRDLRASRTANTITARVAKGNALAIRPVAFRVELFVVLEHGRRVGLSIARFVQVKGAASGFHKVLEVVDGVMRGRGWLVEDEEKWRALCDVVSGC